MNPVFGGPFHVRDETALPDAARPSSEDYAEWIRQTLGTMKAGDAGILRLRRPRPTAAFSPQDAAHPLYDGARELAREAGFAPIERGTGGRLSIFDEGAIGVTLLAPLHAPQETMMHRYERFAGAIATALRSLDVEARVGELPNEYCPGKFSINAAGRVKLVGIAQRMTSRGYQMGAVIAVEHSAAAREALTSVYQLMELPFDRGTYGAVRDFAPHLSHASVAQAVVREIVATVA